MKEYKRSRLPSALLCALLMVSAMAVVLSAGYSSAEDTGPEEVEIDGCTYFLLDNVYYYVTSDEEAEEEVAVAGIKDAGSSVDVFVTGAFDFDEVTYSVTGILGADDEGSLGAFSDVTIKSLLLPTTIMSIGPGAFDSLVVTDGLVIPALLDGDTVIVVGQPDEETESGCVEMAADEYFADHASYSGSFIDDSTLITVSFHINVTDPAELKATNAADFEDGTYTQDFYDGVNNVLYGTLFARDYFTMAGWSKVADPGEGDEIVDDGADTEYSFALESTDYYAVWEEDSCFEDYPEWMMWLTVVIIVVLAVAGVSKYVYGMMQNRAR